MLAAIAFRPGLRVGEAEAVQLQAGWRWQTGDAQALALAAAARSAMKVLTETGGRLPLYANPGVQHAVCGRYGAPAVVHAKHLREPHARGAPLPPGGDDS